MASPVELVIRVLADTSHANAAFQGLSGNIGRAVGVGAAGVAVGGVVAVTTQAAIDTQTAMARLQVAVNSADFAPGTARFAAAKAQIQKDSTELATSFDDVASVYAQASRFVDQFGNKLPVDKLNEYTDTVVRLSKVSTDNMAPTDIGQDLDVLAKLYNSTDFNKLGSEIAQLAQSHNQGEGITFQTAIPIAQYGAGMGVTPEQALGTATYLADRQAGGNQAGASIGRMFMRMDAAADNLLDPTETAASAKKSREAGERLDDLQSSLAVAQQRESQMYGQHGLKTAYQRDPAALMASQNEIAKLQREIADQQADMATARTAGPGRGQMDVAAMARIAGVAAQDYANEIKNDPMNALLEYTRAVGALPEAQRGAAFRAAGIINVRDLKTANVLASEPDVLARYIDEATSAGTSQTALAQQSGVLLDTTASKATDVASMQHNVAAAAGEPAREGLDAMLDGILKLGKAAGDDAGPVGALVGALTMAGPIGGAALQILGPIAAWKLLSAGGGAAGSAAGAGAGAGGIGSALGTYGPAAAGLIGGAASAAGLYALNQDVIQNGSFGERLSTLLTGQGANNGMWSAAAPIDAAAKGVVHTGDIIINHPGDIEAQAEKYKQDMIALLSGAWNAAQGSTPVPPTVGGNIGGRGPN